MLCRDLFARPLVEVAPSPATQGRLYWHGCFNTAGVKIMEQGLRVDGIRSKMPKGYIPPAHQAVYLTPHFIYALKFACRDNKQKYGWMFTCPGSVLSDAEPDEDDIGLAVQAAFKVARFPANARIEQYERLAQPTICLAKSNPRVAAELMSLARELLPEDLLAKMQPGADHNPKWLADVGAILSPRLSDATKHLMIDAGCHVAHRANVQPFQAWRFPPKLWSDINNDSLRTSPLAALAKHAEQMR